MKYFVLILISFFAKFALADCLTTLDISGAISMGTQDYIQRALRTAAEQKCSAIYLRVNTPGGSLQASRKIVEDILNSPIPFLCLITPQGAHAGSAGAIILQACHVTGALAATNIGAATPISGTGEKMDEALKTKIINDTVSWMEGVTQLRGRNLDFSKRMITEGISLSSEEAVKEKVIDILALSEMDFLQKAHLREVVTGSENLKTIVNVGAVQEYQKDLRGKILDFVSDPEFVYLIFMGSLALLYAEITNPGLIGPGVVGTLGLILSLVAFNKLNVEWGGLALIILGLGLLVAELFITSFGVLGIGGIVSLFVGSVLLFDVATSGYSLPYSLITIVVGSVAVIFGGLAYFAAKTLRTKSKGHDDDLKELANRIVYLDPNGMVGKIEVAGEVWNFESDDVLFSGDQVTVYAREGLILKVKKNKE